MTAAYVVGQDVEVRTTTTTGDEWRPTRVLKTYGPSATVLEIEARQPGGQPYMYRVHTDDVRPVTPPEQRDARRAREGAG